MYFANLGGNLVEHDPFDMLFRAKWNVPQATAALGHPANEHCWRKVMQEFKEYCKQREKTQLFFNDAIQLSLFS